jgi:uncharacterized protein (DUF1501 family)
MARRFAEAGVRFVEICHANWDTHGGLKQRVPQLCGQIDQGMGALLEDLAQRGLLEDTLVLWGGEFGRTPVAELPALNGRDHNHYGFTCWLAGGGVRGGYVHGATDEFGFRAVEKPVHVHDLHATMLHLLGFDHERLTYRYAGRDFRFTDVHGSVVQELIG